MTQGAGKRTRSRQCSSDAVEEVECGFIWASWEATWENEKNQQANCDDEGNTSSFSRACLFKNQTFESLISTPAPTPANCADDIVKRSRSIDLTVGSGCGYLTKRDEREIIDEVFAYHSGFKQNSWLKFDLFIRSGQSLSGEKDVLKIDCVGRVDHIQIKTRGLNTTHFDLTFQFRNKLMNMETLVAGAFNIFDKWFEIEYNTAWESGSQGQKVTIKVAGYFEEGYVITDDIKTRGSTDTFEHKLGGGNSIDGKIRGYRFWHGHRDSVNLCDAEISKAEYAKCGGEICVGISQDQPRFKADYGVCLLYDGLNGQQAMYLNKCTDTCRAYEYCQNIFIPTWPQVLPIAGTERACTAVINWNEWSAWDAGKRTRTQINVTCQYGSGDSLVEMECGQNDHYKSLLNQQEEMTTTTSTPTTTNSVTINSDDCEEGWTKLSIISNTDKCFKVFGVGTAEEAIEMCNCHNAGLPVPTDATENGQYINLIKQSSLKDDFKAWSKRKTGVWLGLSDVASEGNLAYIQTGELYSIPSGVKRKIAQDHPDDDYIVLFTTNVWQDQSSNFQDINILCEKSLGT